VVAPPTSFPRPRALLWGVLCCVLFARTAPARDGFMARVRWRPSGSREIAGYLIHLRRLDGGQDVVAQDAGLPPIAEDGTQSTILGPLDAGIDYAFSVRAYAGAGVESARSNEIILWAQLCCAAGECANSVKPLGVDSFAVRRARAGSLLVARGAYLAGHAFDPTRSGIRVEVRASDGAPLYRAQAGAGAFHTNRIGSLFRYRPTGRRSRANGLRRLVLHRNGDAVDVVVAARVPRLKAAGAQAPVAWTLQLGDECAAARSLGCRAAPGHFRCE
jgi:hypothetical protein